LSSSVSYRRPTGQSAVRGASLPHGYRHGHHEIEVGYGGRAFEAAVEGLRGWTAHRAAGVEVWLMATPPAEGATVVLLIHVGPLWVVAACRVVYD
jgi:uncharacterized protein (UPF0548 family)